MNIQEKKEKLKKEIANLEKQAAFEEEKKKTIQYVDNQYNVWKEKNKKRLAAYLKYYNDLFKEKGEEIILKKDHDVIEFNMTPHINRYDQEKWEGEKIEDKCFFPQISYRGKVIYVKERIVYPRSSFRGVNKGYQMMVKFDDYKERFYKSAKSIIKKIDEEVENEKEEKMYELREKQAYENVLKQLKNSYPNYELKIEKKGRYYSNQWKEYPYIRITLPNKNWILISVNSYNEKIHISEFKDYRAENKDVHQLIEYLK